MTSPTVTKDPETRTMTVTAHFDAPVERVWDIWSDPRKLERWWGPPTYPATVQTHELTPGGAVTYFMTGPEGDRHHGYWQIRAVDPPRSLEFEDGFADADGNPDPSKPASVVRVTLTEASEGTTAMQITSVFPSNEAMEELLAMGMEEGMVSAIGQIDDILAEPVR